MKLRLGHGKHKMSLETVVNAREKKTQKQTNKNSSQANKNRAYQTDTGANCKMFAKCSNVPNWNTLRNKINK